MTQSESRRGLWLSIGLAFVLWFIMFVLKPFNFWVMLTFSTSLLSAVAFVLGRPLFMDREFTATNFFVGVLLAALLYALFYAGNQFLMIVSRLFPALLPDRAGNIASVYANLGGLSPTLVGLLLFFPIGFGEELFWRGFVQRRLSGAPRAGARRTYGAAEPAEAPVLLRQGFGGHPHSSTVGRLWLPAKAGERGNATSAFVLTTLLYTAIHVPTGNPVLILAALTCGLFWGGFYWLTGRLVPVLVSHMLWDPFIFVIMPIR